MPKEGELITAKEFADLTGLTSKSIITYGQQGKIMRRKVKGKFKYYWGSFKGKEKVRYVCDECGKSDKECRRMMIQKFIDQTLVQLDKFVGCEC